MASVTKREWTHKGETREAWVVRYMDGAGKQRLKTFAKKKDADRFRGDVEVSVRRGGHTPDRVSPAIRDLAEDYLRQVDQRVKEGRLGKASSYNIGVAIRKHLVPHLGAMKIKDVTLKDVELWHAKLLEWLSPVVAKESINRAARMESYARKHDLTTKDVFAEYLKDVRGVAKPPIKTFQAAQVRKLLETAEIRLPGQRHRAHLLARCFVNIAAFCGLRIGEIAALTPESVDRAEGVIRVRRSATQFGEIKAPKTRAGVRDVPMPEHVSALLSEWTIRYFEPNPDGLLFLTPGSQRPYRPSLFEHLWEPLLVKAGLHAGADKFHFHALRHFAASWMIENGMSLPDVASLMGHARFDMTLQVYAHPIISEARRHKAVQGMATKLLTLEGAPAHP